MNVMNRLQRILAGMILLAVMAAVVFPVAAQAQSAAPADEWKFSITPYLWLPNINGTLNYDIPPGAGGSPNVEVGPNDYLQALQAVLLLSGEVRKDRWSVFADLVYLAFSDQTSSVKTIDFGGSLVGSSANLNTSSSLKGGIGTLGAGYAVLTGRRATLEVFGGLRYFELSSSTDWQLSVEVTGPSGVQTFPGSGEISQKLALWDGIVGVKGRVPFGSSHWSIPYYLDAGGGSSNLTYQWMIGVAYSFGWGDVTLAYRDLFYDQKDDEFIQDMRFSGPALAATFRF